MEEAKKNLSPEAFKNFNTWFSESEYSVFKTELKNLLDQKEFEELEDRFYKHIEIGTAGIRGIIGAGPNRINFRTIGEAAQGLVQFIEDFGEEAKQKGVVVSHEVRKFSREFAVLCCEVLAGNGMKSYLFDGIRSTPEVSFAVRKLNATAGIQITASHSPKTDNGFKFFWAYGGQVTPPLDEKYMNLVLNVQDIKKLNFSEAKSKGLVTIIGEEVDKSYLEEISKLSLVKTRSAKIAFSPLHSSGSTNALPVLEKEGFAVGVVEEQAAPDENFPTAYGDFINPEYEELLDLPIKLAKKIDADLAICTDPDACRVAAAVRPNISSKELFALTGNELGAIMTHFILSRMKEEGALRKEHLVLITNVTSTLISDIAKSFGIKITDDLLVGFKWIGQILEDLENKNDFVLGFEETLGYLRGDFIRDKDAAIGAFTLAEIVSWLKDRNKTAVNYLNEIYESYGYYRNIVNMVTMAGKVGFEDKEKCMKAFRFNPPVEIAGLKVLKVIDRLDENLRDPEKYKAGVTGDQISFVLSEDGRTKFTVRPSGTDPQLKYYFQHYGRVDNDLQRVKKEIDSVADKLETAIFKFQDKVLGKKIQGHSFKSKW